MDAGFGKIDISGAQPVFDTAVVPEVTNWQLDLLGNWAGAPAGSYDSVRVFRDADGDRVPDPSEVTTFTDHQVTDAFNRISERRYSEFDQNGDPIGGEQVNLKYDAAGNLIFDGEQLYVFDASNRLVETKQKGNLAVDSNGVLDGEPGDTVGEYTYDARGRLINRKVSNSGGLNTDGAGEFFYYDGARDIEHHKSDVGGVLSLHRQYVYGLEYVDEVVAYNDSVVDDWDEAYLHRVLQDANYNVVAVTDSGGEVEQQYTYSPYGARLTAEALDWTNYPNFTLSPINLETEQHTLLTQKGFQGLTHLPEIDGVQNRNRVLLPPLGRFLQGDQNGTGLIVLSGLGFHGDPPMVSVAVNPDIQYADGLNIFNAFASNPASNADPTGLFAGSPARLVTEMVGAATASYVFGLDAGVYSLLEEGAHGSGLDDALAAYPYLFSGGMAGGLVSGATGFSSAGNVLGGGIAGGIVTYGMGVGFGQGFRAGAATTAEMEALFAAAGYLASKFGGWMDSIKVGAGAARQSGRGFWRGMRARGLVPACFAEGTLIAMADGSMREIELIESGNVVKCDLDPEAKNGTEACVVTATFERITDELVELEVLSESGKSTIVTTPEHPFYVPCEGDYVAARLLRPSVAVVSQFGNLTLVGSALLRPATARVYNIEVAGGHNYFVSESGILVHNACRPPSWGLWREMSKEHGIPPGVLHERFESIKSEGAGLGPKQGTRVNDETGDVFNWTEGHEEFQEIIGNVLDNF